MLQNKTIAILIIIVIAALDQITKTQIISYLQTLPGYSQKIFSWLQMVYTWNYGVSFGLFSEYYQYSNYSFIAINSAIILYLIYLLFTNLELNKIALAVIIGGAIGNLIDRIFRGAVFDFVYLHYEAYYFPAFNLADVMISFGAAIFLIDFFLQRK